MAKQSLKSYLNSELKKKGISSKEAQKNASKYSSIKEAKAAGSLYYTNKKGKVMAAVYAEDLNKKPIAVRPKVRPDTATLAGDGMGQMTVAEKKEVDAANAAIRLAEKARRDTGPNAARKKPLTKKVSPRLLREGGPRTEKNVGAAKGGMMTKKSTGYNKGGMPMVMKNGKKVPAYAADGVGKMNMGGMAKKKPTTKMMGGGMAKKKPAAKMMGGGMAKKKAGAYNYGGMAKKKK